MTHLRAFILAAALTAPAVSYGALSFDLNEDISTSGYGYGISIRDSAGFDSLAGQGTTTGTPVTNTLDPGGTAGATFDFEGEAPAPGAGISTAERYADLVLTNNTTNNGYDNRINEFWVSYTLNTATISGTAFGSVDLYWAPSAVAGAADILGQNGLAGFTKLPTVAGPPGAPSSDGTDINNGSNTIRFSGEQIYAAGGSAPPLLANNQSGVLRFVFQAAGAPGASYTQTIGGISIMAVVPEPSSALLLTSVLGLFGSTFRRRRKVTAE